LLGRRVRKLQITL